MTEEAVLQDFLRTLGAREEEMLELLRALVNQDTPSGDAARVNAGIALVEAACRARGALVERIAGGAGDHLRARWAADHADAPRALLLAHVDTVWPAGEAQRRPFTEEGGFLTGPGVFDMKAGLVQALFAIDAFVRGADGGTCDVTLLITSDEESGSATSRAVIEETARESDVVLVAEPASGGALKTARKGVGSYRLQVEGRASHAGLALEEGASAALELAHQVVRLHELNDPASDSTVTVTMLEGGSARNVVPAHASATIDLRVVADEEGQRLDAMIRDLPPVLAGTRLSVEGGLERPPMERSPQAVALFERFRSLADAIGEAVEEAPIVGGGSDGNFTAALGVPTLDGLGAVGEGAHALHERVERAAVPRRAALLAALLRALGLREVPLPARPAQSQA